MSTIYFYREYDKYGEFSNFYPCPIVIDNKEFSTAEHYFQAMKFHHNPAYFEKIRTCQSPSIAFKLGRTREIRICNNWKQIKDDIMLKVLMAKFTQNERLKNLQINTKNALLVEHTERDKYWADGGNNSGKNMLGKLLMQVRRDIIE